MVAVIRPDRIGEAARARRAAESLAKVEPSLEILSRLLHGFEEDGFHHVGFAADLGRMSRILDGLPFLPDSSAVGCHLISFLLEIMSEIDVGLIQFPLKVLGKTLYLSDVAYKQFIDSDPAGQLISLLSSDDVSIEARSLVYDILLKIVEFDADTLYSIRSNLFAEFVNRLPEHEFTLPYLEVVDGFIRNHTRDQIESFAAAIIEFGLQLWRLPTVHKFAKSLIPVFSDLCAKGFVEPVVGNIGFEELMETFSRRQFRRSFGDFARLAIQFIELDKDLIQAVPLPALIDLLGKTKGRKCCEDILELLVVIAAKGFLPLILEADPNEVLFVAAGREFRVRQLVLTIYWRGFLGLTEMMDRFDVANSDVMLLMACGPVPADLLDEIFTRLYEMCQYSRFNGSHLFSQDARDVLTEFVAEFLQAESHEIAEMAEHLQEFFL
jgi:hypothetical protein